MFHIYVYCRLCALYFLYTFNDINNVKSYLSGKNFYSFKIFIFVKSRKLVVKSRVKDKHFSLATLRRTRSTYEYMSQFNETSQMMSSLFPFFSMRSFFSDG